MKKLFDPLGDLGFLFRWLRGWLEKRKARQEDEAVFSEMDDARANVPDDDGVLGDDGSDPDNRGGFVDSEDDNRTGER